MIHSGMTHGFHIGRASIITINVIMRAVVMRICPGFVVAAVVVLGACASTPAFDVKNVNTAITPNEAVAKMSTLQGSRVLWGGVIINSKNLETGTHLEILAHPLNSRHRPRVDRDSLGRFVVEHVSYLETVDYAIGRELSLIGMLAGTKEGKIDAASTIYPAVKTEQIHLWPKGGGNSEPQFNFGVGVMFHN